MFISIIHTYPLNDLKPHDLGDQTDCWCKPRVEEFENGMCNVVHNSMDGREDYETGKRKLN